MRTAPPRKLDISVPQSTENNRRGYYPALGEDRTRYTVRRRTAYEAYLRVAGLVSGDYGYLGEADGLETSAEYPFLTLSKLDELRQERKRRSDAASEPLSEELEREIEQRVREGVANRTLRLHQGQGLARVTRVNRDRVSERRLLLQQRRRRKRGQRELDGAQPWELYREIVHLYHSKTFGDRRLSTYNSPQPETIERFLEMHGLAKRATDLSKPRTFPAPITKIRTKGKKGRIRICKPLPKPRYPRPGKVFYSLSSDAADEQKRALYAMRKALKDYSLAPKKPREQGFVPGWYPTDCGCYFLEGLWEEIRGVWYPFQKGMGYRWKGSTWDLRNPDQTLKNMATRVPTRARGVVRHRGPKEPEYYIPDAWQKGGKEYKERQDFERNEPWRARLNKLADDMYTRRSRQEREQEEIGERCCKWLEWKWKDEKNRKKALQEAANERWVELERARIGAQVRGAYVLPVESKVVRMFIRVYGGESVVYEGKRGPYPLRVTKRITRPHLLVELEQEVHRAPSDTNPPRHHLPPPEPVRTRSQKAQSRQDSEVEILVGHQSWFDGGQEDDLREDAVNSDEKILVEPPLTEAETEKILLGQSLRSETPQDVAAPQDVGEVEETLEPLPGQNLGEGQEEEVRQPERLALHG